MSKVAEISPYPPESGKISPIMTSGGSWKKFLKKYRSPPLTQSTVDDTWYKLARSKFRTREIVDGFLSTTGFFVIPEMFGRLALTS